MNKFTKITTLLLVCLMVTGYLFANAVCFPSLPSMQRHFLAPTLTVQSIILIFTFGLGISQLFYGPLTEFYGRRNVVLLGTLIFIAGGILTLFPLSIHALIVARLIQGSGAGCYSVVGKAITHDIFKDKFYVNATVLVMIFSVLTQMLSPTIGGYLNSAYSWHANFTAVLIYSSIIFVLIYFFLPETQISNTYANLKQVLNNYRLILVGPRFWWLLLISALTLGTISIYQIVSPFILQDTMHISSVAYGWSLLCSSSGFLIGNLMLIFLNRGNSLIQNIMIGLIFMLLGAVLMLSLQNHVAPIAIILPALIFNIGTGIVFPLSTAGALLEYQSMPGSAGAIIGSLQMLLMALIGLFAGYIHILNQGSLGWMLLIITAACALLHLIASNVFVIKQAAT
jgi:MFS family permease